MSRISNYTVDNTIEQSDKVLGSNLGGETKNFNMQDIAEWLTSTNATGNPSSIPYKYESQSANSGSMTFQGNTNTELAFPTGENQILQVNKDPNGKNDRSILPILNTYLNKEIIISQVQDPTIFGVYKVKSISQINSTDVYRVTMDYISGNNNSNGKALYSNVYYNLVPFSAAQDREFAIAFSTSDLTYDSNANEYYFQFNHNLGKFPSITVKVSTGYIVEVPVKHITKNQSQVYFKGQNSGTVYAN